MVLVSLFSLITECPVRMGKIFQCGTDVSQGSHVQKVNASFARCSLLGRSVAFTTEAPQSFAVFFFGRLPPWNFIWEYSMPCGLCDQSGPFSYDFLFSRINCKTIVILGHQEPEYHRRFWTTGDPWRHAKTCCFRGIKQTTCVQAMKL